MLNAVSTSSLYAIPRTAVADLQSRLVNAESELTSGEIANPIETLGSRFGLDQSLRSQASTLTNLQSTNAVVSNALQSSQDALTKMSSDAQSFMNTLVTAQSTGNVSTLASQAQSFLDAFTNYANTTSAGAYVFGGSNATVAPMASYSGTPQTAAAAAVGAAFQTAFGFSQSSPQAGTISTTGMQSFLSGGFADLFADPSWGTDWSKASSTPSSAVISPGQTVTTSVTATATAFRQLASAYTSIADLGIDNLNGSTQQTVIGNALQQVSAAIQGLTNMQAQLGFSQSRITAANKALDTQLSTIDNTVNQLDGVDPYKAAEKLTNLTTQLETAYSLTNRISKLGLVNYL
jgi:flagellar hook-associated protein 3 FlgL